MLKISTRSGFVGNIRFSSKSSKQWLARQKHDPYVKARVASDYVARSAFKLLEMHEATEKAAGKHDYAHLLRPGMTVVDLGAAPGGFTQVAWEKVVKEDMEVFDDENSYSGSGLVVGIDLLPLADSVASLPAVETIQGDFLAQKTHDKLFGLLHDYGKEDVDLVLSDMLPNVGGNRDVDAARSAQVCLSALDFAKQVLFPVTLYNEKVTPSNFPPVLIMKFLQSGETEIIKSELRKYFYDVRWEKPPSSRGDSREGFWVCRGFKGGEQEEKTVEDKVEIANSLFF